MKVRHWEWAPRVKGHTAPTVRHLCFMLVAQGESFFSLLLQRIDLPTRPSYLSGTLVKMLTLSSLSWAWHFVTATRKVTRTQLEWQACITSIFPQIPTYLPSTKELWKARTTY